MLSNVFPPDFNTVQRIVYEPCGFVCDEIVKNSESKEYGGVSCRINGYHVQYRIAKITPTKVGQFVTFWKRIGKGPIVPYDIADPVDFFVVTVCTQERFGQFVFPKGVLHKHGFVSLHGKGGKRAMRVYPSWDKPDSLQAKKTQAWQGKYFFEITEQAVDCLLVQKFFEARV